MGISYAEMKGAHAQVVPASSDEGDEGLELSIQFMALVTPSPVGKPGCDLGLAIDGDDGLVVRVQPAMPDPAVVVVSVPRQAGD